MPAPFHRLSLAQFRLLMDRTLLRRQINAVHVHHTWKPARADWRGLPTIEAMWRYHLSLGWDDIAQHVTVDPAGGIWTGRNWNAPPASSSGHNGTSAAGPFMFEMVGNFDTGHDLFDGAERQAALDVTAHVLTTFGLAVDAIRFHYELNNRKKTCPGTGIDKAVFVKAVAKAMTDPAPRGSRGARRARGPHAPAGRPFDPKFLLGYEVTQPATAAVDLSAATVPEHDAAARAIDGGARVGTGAAQRARQLSRDFSRLQTKPGARGEDWSELQPHVVNLTNGELSESGEFTSSPADLDAIVDAIRDRAASTPNLRVMIHAHGGLVSETNALDYARTMYRWWLSKDVYPVFFVWETHLLEVLRQALPRARDFGDVVTDPVLEEGARLLGRPAWNRMKGSALRASAPDLGDGVAGGARTFARKLGAFLQSTAASQVTVHGVGHSAGAIFHAFFLPALVEAGVPSVASLSLLAPAIRTDLFVARLLPLISDGTIARHHHFTMEDEAERDDNVVGVYQKSLLYLISEALEADRRDPILGLQRAMKNDATLKALYGLDADGFPGPGQGASELHYSFAEGKPENGLTRSRSHGGFDNDVKTMSSVLRRIVGVPDSTGFGESDFPPDASRGIDAELRGARGARALPASPAGSSAAVGPSGGRRAALCIGIDRYRIRPLAGCVNDARTWSQALTAMGFEVRQLFDEQATARGIEDAIRDLLGRAGPGDVLALQYAGHGSQLADDNGDESDGIDEALVPVDFHTGALVLRDDLIAEAISHLPAGAALTLFMDCCHCGTNSRFAPAIRAAESLRDRVRYLPLPPEVQRAARSMRRARGLSRVLESSAPGVVHLAACQDSEFAWESDGQGDFTRAAVPELAASVGRGDTNEQFLDAVRRIVQARGRQHPQMMSPAAGMSGRRLLTPLDAGAPGGRVPASPTTPVTDIDRQLLHHLEAAVDLLRRRLG